MISQTQSVIIKIIESKNVQNICHKMDISFPKWIEQAEITQNRIFFSASIENRYVGILGMEFATDNNAHIDWLVVKDSVQLQAITEKLLLFAEIYCYEHEYTSITLETISSKIKNENDLKYYRLYEKAGFNPLFERYTHDPHQLIVYMQKTLRLNDFTFVDLTHTLSQDVPHWGIDVGFKYNARFINTNDSADVVKFRVQRLEMSSGIGTHMDAPSHCFENLPAIDAIPLRSLITICRVIDVSKQANERYQVTVDDIIQFERDYGNIPHGAFVIIYTGWSKRWSEPDKYRNEKIFPCISVEAAEHLLSRHIVGLGIDTLSPDAFGSKFPVHSLILGAGKYIIENVANADQLDPIGCYIFALPIKVLDGTEAPMRLVGMKRNII